MLYPFSQIISLLFCVRRWHGSLRKNWTENKSRNGCGMFFFASFFATPVYTALQRLELFTDVKGEFCDKKKHDLCRAYRWITTFSYGTKHKLWTHDGWIPNSLRHKFISQSKINIWDLDKVRKFRKQFRVSSILPKNLQKQFDLRYHSSRIKVFYSFFGRMEGAIDRF